MVTYFASNHRHSNLPFRAKTDCGDKALTVATASLGGAGAFAELQDTVQDASRFVDGLRSKGSACPFSVTWNHTEVGDCCVSILRGPDAKTNAVLVRYLAVIATAALKEDCWCERAQC